MRPSRPEPEYAPLLPEGLHPVDETALRQLCLASFPRSRTRPRLYEGLEQLIALLRNSRIAAEVWIDGSFVTRKPDPRDVDVVVWVHASVLKQPDAGQPDLLRTLRSNGRRTRGGCDTFVAPYHEPGSPDRWLTDKVAAYWLEEFGMSRSGRPKGILVVEVSET